MEWAINQIKLKRAIAIVGDGNLDKLISCYRGLGGLVDETALPKKIEEVVAEVIQEPVEIVKEESVSTEPIKPKRKYARKTSK